MEKLNTIILIISFLLIGCNKNDSSDSAVLNVTSGFNEEKYILKYVFENGLVKGTDSIKINDPNNIIKFDVRFPNLIIDSKVISSFGVSYDLNENKIIVVDSSGHKVKNSGLLLKTDEKNLYFYNFEYKTIVKHELSSNLLTLNENGVEFDLPVLNSFPCVNYISPDLKNIILFSSNDKNDFKTPRDIFVKNLITGNKKKILTSIYGTSMSTFSSTMPMPSIKWISEKEFVYTDFKVLDTVTNCTVKKYDLFKNQSVVIGTINSIPLSTFNSTFEFDEKKNLFLKCKKGIFQIDYIKNNIEANKWKYDLGSNFKIINSNGLFQILSESKVIFKESENEKLDSHWNSFKSTKGYLVFIINKQKNDINYTSEKILVVYSEKKDELIELKKEEFTSILDWTEK